MFKSLLISYLDYLDYLAYESIKYSDFEFDIIACKKS